MNKANPGGKRARTGGFGTHVDSAGGAMPAALRGLDKRRRAGANRPGSIKSACINVGGSVLAVVLVDSADTLPEQGDAMLVRLQPHFPTLPIMLVSIEDNGFRAFATFQTSELLALLQLEHVAFADVEIDAASSAAGELPF